VAIYGYAVQIFFDFSGYTDIAIGVALLMGFKLPVNFNAPYKASSVREFWRRWHISLSSWLKDYLYIPLGGSKKGKMRTTINLMITMLLGGLWHGAHLRFLVWGLYHGILLVVERWLKDLRSHRQALQQRKWLFQLLTFNLIVVGWLIFRADSPRMGIAMLGQIFSGSGFAHIGQFIGSYSLVSAVLVFSFLFIALPVHRKEQFRGWFISQKYTVKLMLILIVLFVVYQFQTTELIPFIYFQF